MITSITTRIINNTRIRVTVSQKHISAKVVSFPFFNTPDAGNVEVVQTTGDSVTKVMSQNAVTQALLQQEFYKQSDW